MNIVLIVFFVLLYFTFNAAALLSMQKSETEYGIGTKMVIFLFGVPIVMFFVINLAIFYIFTNKKKEEE